MTLRPHMILLTAALCIGLGAYGQTKLEAGARTVRTISQNQGGEFSVFASITKYLTLGDAASLSSWFADNLDVTVISSTRNCSRKQAQEILRSFFEANTPRSFQVTHKASEGNKKYLIGLLNAGGELFQVTIYATASAGDTYKIQQLNISRQTAY